jgi:hypothetical protein
MGLVWHGTHRSASGMETRSEFRVSLKEVGDRGRINQNQRILRRISEF